MSLPSTVLLEVQTGGSDTTGAGGFDPANANMIATGSVASANTSAPVISAGLSYSFQSRDVGHWVYLQTGTAVIPGWYHILSVSGGSATLDGAIGHAVLPGFTPSTAVGCGTSASLSSVTFAIDYTQNGASITFTSGIISPSSTPGSTIEGTDFQLSMVGNCLVIPSGITNATPGIYMIVSVTKSTSAVLDRNWNTDVVSSGTIYAGGSLASPAFALSKMVAGANIFVKSGTYTISSISSNVAGGRLNFNVSGNSVGTPIRLRGYNALRGDLDGVMDSTSRPLLQVAVSGVTAISVVTFNYGNPYISLENVNIDGQNKSGIIGLQGTGYANFAVRCKVINCGASNSKHAVQLQQNFGLLFSEIANCTTGNFASLSISEGFAYGCVIHDGVGKGIDVSGQGSVSYCIVYNQSGTVGYGIGVDGSQTALIEHCACFNNSMDNFAILTANTGMRIIDCISVGAGGFGFNGNSNGSGLTMFHCADYGSTSGGFNTASNSVPAINEKFLTLTGNPFTNASAGDFSLNATAGAGAALRAAGVLGVFPGLLTTGYGDIGAAQTKSSSGGTSFPQGLSLMLGPDGE